MKELIRDIIKHCKGVAYELVHREVFDHYYVHPESINKDTRIIPRWQYRIYNWILVNCRTWRHDWHDTIDHVNERQKSRRYTDNRKFYTKQKVTLQ